MGLDPAKKKRKGAPTGDGGTPRGEKKLDPKFLRKGDGR